MEQFSGKSIFRGTVLGKIHVYSGNRKKVIHLKIEDIDAEIARYEQARETAIKQLEELGNKTKSYTSEESAKIFEVHCMLLEDESHKASVYSIIRSEAVNAEYAVKATCDSLASKFSKIEDDFFKARIDDVIDISERVIAVLQGENTGDETIDGPCIVVADNLTPSEIVHIGIDKLLAFVTKQGSLNSHTMILARTMGIPALIGVDIKEEWNGKNAIVDGDNGFFIVEPDITTFERYEKKIEESKRDLKQHNEHISSEYDGKHIHICANIGSVADIEYVLASDADGIGLVRSELLFLNRNNYPTEEEQFQAYKTIVQSMSEKKVVIRTLDIGADKQVSYYSMEHEDNPALGCRGIRISLNQVDVFKTQLRAIYRASAFGKVSIMFPMIISVEEVIDIKKICKEVCDELDRRGVKYGDVKLGTMIETPAAVMISDLLAKEVDFFSIGTNDLTQYTLAIDRQNSRLDNIYDSQHPAVLRMIQMVVDNGHKGGVLVGICGELAADETLTETLVKMGIDELSVAPAFVQSIKQAVDRIEANRLI